MLKDTDVKLNITDARLPAGPAWVIRLNPRRTAVPPTG